MRNLMIITAVARPALNSMFDRAVVVVDRITQALARQLSYQHLGHEEPSPLPCLEPSPQSNRLIAIRRGTSSSNFGYWPGGSSIGAPVDGWKRGGC